MKRLTTFLLIFLFALTLQGQKVIMNEGKAKVLYAYDANQPLNLPETCEVWLDGKHPGSFTLDGTSVDQWDDRSGNGNHVLNGNANATRPTYDVNTGRVTFTAANSTFLASAVFGAPLTQPNTVFIVYKANGTGYYANFNSTSSGLYVIFRGFSVFDFGAPITLTYDAYNTNDNFHVALFNGASSELWLNGVSSVTGNAGSSSIDRIVLGGRGAGNSPSDVEIMEVIVYNADISDVSRDKITGYLANKWGITATTDFKGYIIRQD